MTENAGERAENFKKEARLLEEDAAGLEEKAHTEERQAHELEEEAHRIEDAKRREHDGDHDKPDHGKGGHDHQCVEITMVVNGQPVVIKATKGQRLSEVRHKALEETQNLGQPPENWEIKSEAGDVLDPEKKVGEFDFGDQVTLFLSLKAGVAGV